MDSRFFKRTGREQMTNTKDVIIQLKKVREEKKLSYNDIMKLMEKNGDYLAKSTLSRVFGEGSEEMSFKYDETIRPIAKAMLDIETIEDDDDIDAKAMKSILKYKIQRIEDLEKQLDHLQKALDKEIIKGQEKLIAAQEEAQRKFDFMSNQIALKDKRIDNLLESTTKLLNQILDCPCRIKHES